MLTNADISRIDMALEAASGDRTVACQVLGITRKQLRYAIKDHAELRAKWSRRSTPTAAPNTLTTLGVGPIPNHQPVLPPGVSPAEHQLAAILKKEDSALKRGLSKIISDPEQLKEMAALANFHGQHHTRVVDIFGGGLVQRGAGLLVVIKRLEKDILDGENMRDVFSPEGFLIKSGEESKCELYFRALEEYRKMTGMVYVGLEARGKIERWKKQTGSGGTPKGKPGFGTLRANNAQVLAQPGSHLHLHGTDAVEPAEPSPHASPEPQVEPLTEPTDAT